MPNIVLIFIAGGVGCLSRFGLVSLLSAHAPLGTLLCNALGCLGAGAVYELILTDRISYALATPIVVGFLGGLTTFSTFMLDVMDLWHRESGFHSIAYVLVSVGAGFVLCMVGSTMARWAI